MNDEDKKLLTEFLGECWHEYTFEKQPEDECGEFSCWVCRCGHRTQFWQRQRQNRTFTTWQDMGDLKEKLVGKGMWTNFYPYAKTKCWIDEYFCESNVVAWFLNPAVFIPLVVEFLRKEKV